ncbi:MAG: nitronate monooxygenase [Flavobacteriales bacterium]|nr:nitronate monooxygenase [Crocinitomicaceae bacterium]NBX79305.1 nitronate monooxygenase [Flavobacteriales bacterium]
MTSKAALCTLLNIEFPVIMAPMFLVSNEKMIIEGINAGITGAIPALNYRTIEELRKAIRSIKTQTSGPFGINLIVNQSNFLYKEQLQVCCEEKVDFFITSLGSPEETIKKAHKHGIKVFCDVTDAKFAKKVEGLGADAVIAVCKEAGGHAGNISFKELIPELKKVCTIPVLSAGGIGTGKGIKQMLDLGADGVSMGSIFIATNEAPVSQEYKDACVQYTAKDIVMTTKLSGTPCTVINTPYVQKTGTQQNWLERILNKNKKLKKWMKALTFMKGMKSLQNAAFSSTYKTVWCAGPSIEHVTEIRSVKEVVEELRRDFESA